MTKPPAEKRVLAWDGKQWVRAIWVERNTKEQDTDSDWHDYNEADDTYYWPEGWYEVQTHGGDEMFWHITDGVQVWQEMPVAPSGEQRQDCEPWGWAIVDKNGDDVKKRVRQINFFGAVNHQQEPLTQEDVEQADRDWPGLAPCRLVTL